MYVAPVPSGSPIDTSTLGQHQFAVTATDANAVSTTQSASYAVVAAPTVAVAVPASGGVYFQGQSVAAQFSCATTAPVTIASCAGPVPTGGALATSTLGPQSFTVTATDSNAVATSSTVDYSVIAARPTIGALTQAAARWLERRGAGSRLPLGTGPAQAGVPAVEAAQV